VSKRRDTKEGTQFRLIMEHEEFFFCFWHFANAQELLEVTTKPPLKLNDPVIDVGHNCMSQFLSRISLKSVSSSVLNMTKFSVGE
jgi:hypothetical protein